MFALMRRLALSLIDPRPSDSRLSDLESLWTLESGLFALTGAGTLLEWARWSDGFADTGCESCVDAGSIGGKEGNSGGGDAGSEDSNAESVISEAWDSLTAELAMGGAPSAGGKGGARPRDGSLKLRGGGLAAPIVAPPMPAGGSGGAIPRVFAPLAVGGSGGGRCIISKNPAICAMPTSDAFSVTSSSSLPAREAPRARPGLKLAMRACGGSTGSVFVVVVGLALSSSVSRRDIS